VLVSAELRWFWKDVLPPGLEAFFRDGPYPPGGGLPRDDEYLVDRGQGELGLKKRGSKDGIEVKGLVAGRGISPSPFDARVQIWCKWTSATLTIEHLPRLVVHKIRWLRKFDTTGSDTSEVELDDQERPRLSPDRLPERGCHFELVDLRVNDSRWWTLGFEAFGELDTIEDSLDRTVRHLARSRPTFAAGLELSYPAWLAELHS